MRWEEAEKDAAREQGGGSRRKGGAHAASRSTFREDVFDARLPSPWGDNGDPPPGAHLPAMGEGGVGGIPGCPGGSV